MYTTIIPILAALPLSGLAIAAQSVQGPTVPGPSSQSSVQAPTRLMAFGGRTIRVSGIRGPEIPLTSNPLLASTLTFPRSAAGAASGERQLKLREDGRVARLRGVDVLFGEAAGQSIVATLDANPEGSIQLLRNGRTAAEFPSLEVSTKELVRYAEPYEGFQPQSETIFLRRFDSIVLLGTHAAPTLLVACAWDGSSTRVLVEVNPATRTAHVVGRGASVVHSVDSVTGDDWLMSWESKGAPAAPSRRVARRAANGTWTEWTLPTSRGGFDRVGRLAAHGGKVTLLSGQFGDTRESLALGAWELNPSTSIWSEIDIPTSLSSQLNGEPETALHLGRLDDSIGLVRMIPGTRAVETVQPLADLPRRTLTVPAATPR